METSPEMAKHGRSTGRRGGSRTAPGLCCTSFQNMPAGTAWQRSDAPRPFDGQPAFNPPVAMTADPMKDTP